MINRKLRMGMVGGGSDAFIGAIHRLAANMDGQIELVCGCFSGNPEISISSGKSYYLPDDRVYRNFEEMFQKEAMLPAERRMDFVTIVTPNYLHFKPALLALENKFHVVVDKPITFTLDEAKKLKEKVKESGLVLALTHTYSGYPAVKEARELVKKGVLGNIRRIYVEYPQGWLADKQEEKGNVQAEWRTDPKRSGIAGCMGDIGTHAFHLAEYVTGLQATHLCAELNVFVPGRLLDDDGAALIRFNNGAKGVLMASQIAIGEENDIKIRVYGDKAGLEWTQADPNSLRLKWPGKPAELLRTGQGYLGSTAKHNSRTPPGHPEGYLEAFANIYRNFSLTVRARLEGKEPKPEWLDFPGIDDGVRGMQFIETVVKAGYSDEMKWVEFKL
ncbi:MAG TPA: Gfo/Idh/MocA family oxidoreductase [Bacteroidales bacterium]|nr:Gfo/Idh/MocA family oxidoreductase [Bacteroidales bacterium]